MPVDLVEVLVRFCPEGAPTFDMPRRFMRVPVRGDTISRAEGTFVVVEVEWQADGQPFVIAHAANRPRARAVMGSIAG